MLHLDGVTYTYPFQNEPALRGVSLRIQPGEAVLVTGPSGGGKSTLLRLMNGLIPHVHGGQTEGRVALAGCDMASMSLREISRSVSTLFQDPEKQFLALTVQDEIAFALEWCESDPRAVAEKTQLATHDFGLEELRDASIYELSEGQKQKVALATVSALSPKVLTLDEPTANLDPRASTDLAGHLARLKAEGVTLVIADHRLAWLGGLADRVVVIDQGRVVADGDWSTLCDNDFRMRIGLRDVEWPNCGHVRRSNAPATDCLVRWEQLTFGYRGRPRLFEDADIGVQRNAVTALTGSNGCGKTTLAKLLAGLIKPRRGALRRCGQVIRPRDLLSTTGMAMQNSELQLYQRSAIGEVIHAAGGQGHRLKPVEALGWLRRFGLEGIAARHPQSLSGGQKQRLVVACAAARAGDLLILDEPTSGLDGAQMHALADLLEERRVAGLSSLVITHDLELIARVCTHELRLPIDGDRQDEPVRPPLAMQETR
ncbi:MAG: ATP-binding cassette domain-containing protein [Planctomycetes bacterium]|nr:ATP-binding cassette domain-containing protein [Planctomycetota bacterium]